ncbi:hypothetical protein MRX96_044213 [Rhipicephalus microplus]
MTLAPKTHAATSCTVCGLLCVCALCLFAGGTGEHDLENRTSNRFSAIGCPLTPRRRAFSESLLPRGSSVGLAAPVGC